MVIRMRGFSGSWRLKNGIVFLLWGSSIAPIFAPCKPASTMYNIHVKEAAPRSIQNYFDVHHGKEAWLKDMPAETEPIIRQHLDQGFAFGQYALPGLRPEGDMRIWIPEKVREREQAAAAELERVRQKLQHL